MNQETIKTLVDLNNDYIPRFLADSHEREEVVEPSSSIPVLDENNVTKYGLDYYDLMIANILIKRHNDVQCKLTANIAEIITRLAYEGLRHMHIFDDRTAYRFCNDIALHRIPERALVYQYMIYVLKYPHNVLPYWFYYTLLMWAFIESKIFNNVNYRSRIYVGFIHQCCLTKFMDYNSDRSYDVFNVRDKLKRLILSCTKDPRYKENYKEYVEYMVDSMRVFSIIILSILISRSCKWKIFCNLGNEVMTQRLIEHQHVIDVSYETLVNKGVKKC